VEMPHIQSQTFCLKVWHP